MRADNESPKRDSERARRSAILKPKLPAVTALVVLALIVAGLLIAARNAALERDRSGPVARTITAAGRTVSPHETSDASRRATASAGAGPTSKPTAAPDSSLRKLRSAAEKRDWDTFRTYIDEGAVVESFLDKVDRDGLRGPGGSMIVRPGLGPLTRALIGRIALLALRRAVRGQAVARGVDGGTVDRAMDSTRVTRIRVSGRFARVTLSGGPLRRAVLKMKLVNRRWRVVAIEDFGTF